MAVPGTLCLKSRMVHNWVLLRMIDRLIVATIVIPEEGDKEWKPGLVFFYE